MQYDKNQLNRTKRLIFLITLICLASAFASAAAQTEKFDFRVVNIWFPQVPTGTEIRLTLTRKLADDPNSVSETLTAIVLDGIRDANFDTVWADEEGRECPNYDGMWTANWKGLPRTNADQKKYIYSVENITTADGIDPRHP